MEIIPSTSRSRLQYHQSEKKANETKFNFTFAQFSMKVNHGNALARPVNVKTMQLFINSRYAI